MSKCRECGSEIAFRRLENGKFTPTELDGSDHFDKCSELKTARVMKKGETFKDSKGSGYFYGGKRIYHMLQGPVITGEHYRLIDHICGVLPWEECNCT